jgi:hypothetical protein
MRDLAALVVLVAPPARLARMRPLLLAVPVELAVMPAWPVMVRPVWLAPTVPRGAAMVASGAWAALEVLAQTAALVEQAAVEPQVAVAMAVLVWRPPVASAASAASAARASMPAL